MTLCEIVKIGFSLLRRRKLEKERSEGNIFSHFYYILKCEKLPTELLFLDERRTKRKKIIIILEA